MPTLLPPPQYDVPPNVPVIEYVLSFDDLQKQCTEFSRLKLMPPQFHLGCAAFSLPGTPWQTKDGKPTCFIWYMKGDSQSLRHERAHCAGWKADHAGGIPTTNQIEKKVYCDRTLCSIRE